MKGASHIQGDTTHSPPRMSPSLATPLIICLSFIVLNNFFANVCEKKLCLTYQKPHRTSLIMNALFVKFYYRQTKIQNTFCKSRKVEVRSSVPTKPLFFSESAICWSKGK